MAEAQRRKTKTSSVVKDRYNKKTYEQIAVRIPKDTAQAFKEKCNAEGIAQAQIVKDAIENFLNN